jgi:hypothetical protein
MNHRLSNAASVASDSTLSASKKATPPVFIPKSLGEPIISCKNLSKSKTST